MLCSDTGHRSYSDEIGVTDGVLHTKLEGMWCATALVQMLLDDDLAVVAGSENGKMDRAAASLQRLMAAA